MHGRSRRWGQGVGGLTFMVAALLGPPARAEAPILDASGFVGITHFGNDNQLGNSWAMEQVPGTSVLLGARLGATFLTDLLPSSRLDPSLGVEAEVGFAPAFTGGSFDGGRGSYFAPVFAWRAHTRIVLDGLPRIAPHLVVGGGGQTVVSGSPFMADETDALFYWGAGASVSATSRWMLRLDLRHGVSAGRDGASSSFEAQVGVGMVFGRPAAVARPSVEPVRDLDPPAPDDGDVLPVELPTELPDDLVVDPPPPDRDGDGIVDVNDRCPEEREDADGMDDLDGCADPDDDQDGLLDTADACPREAEVVNGITDEDGCPDVVPPTLARWLGAAGRQSFAKGSAKLSAKTRTALDELAQVLLAQPGVRLIVIGGDLGRDEAARSLAGRRAEAVKWAIVDAGVPIDRIDVEARDATAANPIGAAIEFALAPAAPPSR